MSGKLFYPRSPCGERPHFFKPNKSRISFLSTLSLRRATSGFQRTVNVKRIFYPRSPCGERRPPAPPRQEFYKFSIHALLAESDNRIDCYPQPTSSFLSTLSLRRATIVGEAGNNAIRVFYPRSPCGERLRKCQIIPIIQDFLSTLSLRRATPVRYAGDCTATLFYPRSPCGERRSNQPATMHTWHFLSTLSLRRATKAMWFIIGCPMLFLSTLSLRRATFQPLKDFSFLPIFSIHALLAESDLLFKNHIIFNHSFFLSTLSLRRATAKVHKTVGHFCAYETNFMEIASSC